MVLLKYARTVVRLSRLSVSSVNQRPGGYAPGSGNRTTGSESSPEIHSIVRCPRCGMTSEWNREVHYLIWGKCGKKLKVIG